MTHHNSAGRVLCILSAGALLLAGVPYARASESPQSLAAFEEFAWPSEDEALFLTHQMGSDRGKRTGLTDGMRGSMGSLGGAGGGGGGPSLSIVNPLDVLRQRLLLEMVRRRMRQSEDQIQANRDLLNSVGKRSAPGPAPAGADLRGLLLRRHVRSAARGEEEGSPRQQPSSGGAAHTEHAQHSRLGTTL